MKISAKFTEQVASIAGIHLLMFIIFLFISKHIIIPANCAPGRAIPFLLMASFIYLAFASPTIWLLMFLESIGIRCPDPVTYILIPVNSIIAAIILRGLYAGFQMARKHKAQQGGPGYPSQSVGSPDP